MDVSKNRGIPKSSILIRVSILNHPFWGYPYFLETPTSNVPQPPLCPVPFSKKLVDYAVDARA